MDNVLTVADLIELLRSAPQDWPVWSLDVLYGCEAVSAPVRRIHLNGAASRLEITGDE